MFFTKNPPLIFWQEEKELTNYSSIDEFVFFSAFHRALERLIWTKIENKPIFHSKQTVWTAKFSLEEALQSAWNWEKELDKKS